MRESFLSDSFFEPVREIVFIVEKIFGKQFRIGKPSREERAASRPYSFKYGDAEEFMSCR